MADIGRNRSVDDLRETAPDPLAELREAVLGGLVDHKIFAEAIDKNHRTVRKFMDEGMPYVVIGRTLYVKVHEARAWLLAHGTRDRAPRPVGRPRKAA